MSAVFIPSSLDDLGGELEQSRVAGLPTDLAAKADAAATTASLATKADADTVTEALALKADDSNTVHKTGAAQTVASATTFSSRVTISASGIDIGNGTHTTPAGVDIHLSATDTNTEKAFRFFNDNTNAANNFFRGFQFVLGTGNTISAGFIAFVGLDNAGAVYTIFRASRAGSMPEITFLGRMDVSTIINQSADIGATVSNWVWDGADLKLGPQYDGTRAYGLQLFINSSTASFTWKVFGGPTLATLTGAGVFSILGSLVLPAVADASIPNGGIAWSSTTANTLKCRTPAGVLKTVTLT